MDDINTEALYSHMEKICHLVPISEIEHILNYMIQIENKSQEEIFIPENINKAGITFLQCRLMNQVCHGCGKNSRRGFLKVIPEDYPKLLMCDKCKMTYYCSKECQEKDWSKHKEWCCNVNGPRDLGVNRIVMIDTRSGKVI